MRVIKAKGSLRDIARQVGEETRNDIVPVSEALDTMLHGIPGFDSREAIAEAASRWVRTTVTAVPAVGTWLLGLSEGAGERVGLGMVEKIASSEELLATSTAAPAPERCSTLMVPTPQGPLVGHSEDYGLWAGPLYILDMEPDDAPRSISCNYVGQLPCLAGTLRAAGLDRPGQAPFAMTHNSLPGRSVEGRPLFMSVLMRAAFAPTSAMALGVLTSTPTALSGHVLLVEDGGDGLAYSIEHASDPSDDCHGQFGIVRGAFCHTNHFLHLKGEAGSASSYERFAKLAEPIQSGHLPQSPEAMVEFLSRPDVVFRPPSDDPLASRTRATVVIRPKTGEIWIRDPETDETHHFAL